MNIAAFAFRDRFWAEHTDTSEDMASHKAQDEVLLHFNVLFSEEEGDNKTHKIHVSKSKDWGKEEYREYKCLSRSYKEVENRDSSDFCLSLGQATIIQLLLLLCSRTEWLKAGVGQPMLFKVMNKELKLAGFCSYTISFTFTHSRSVVFSWPQEISLSFFSLGYEMQGKLFQWGHPEQVLLGLQQEVLAFCSLLGYYKIPSSILVKKYFFPSALLFLFLHRTGGLVGHMHQVSLCHIHLCWTQHLSLTWPGNNSPQ